MDTRPIAVVGAGPVGLITALGLAIRGIPVQVIEREPDLFRSPRAMGYHWGSLYILEDLDLLDDVVSAGFTTKGQSLVVRATGDVLDVSAAVLDDRVSFPFGLTLGQDRLAEIVIEHLARYPHARVRWRTEVTGFEDRGDHVAVTLHGPDGPQTLVASWLLGADGASSFVRRELGIDFDGMTWPRAFVATNVQGDFMSLGFRLNNWLVDPEFGAVVCRITPGDLWRVALSVAVDLPEDEVDEAVAAYLRAVLPADFEYEVKARTKYRMHQRCATSMRRGRVVLVGDAAHATNPTSGYGLVGGLHDANILVEALTAIEGGEASDDVLDTYSHERRAAFLNVSSPASVMSKELVFDQPDLATIEARLETLRAVTADPDLLFGFWQGGCYIETPSVVTGERLSRGRNGPLQEPSWLLQ